MTAEAPPDLKARSPRDSAAGSLDAGSVDAGSAAVDAVSLGAAVPGAAAVRKGARPGITASASLVADLDAGRPRIRWTHAWPVVLRPTGQARVHLVHGAGGPLGGDALRLDVRVGAMATLAVRSAGATIVQPGRSGEPARWDTGVVVGADARLDWGPEPTVVTDGATFHTTLRVDLGAGARAVVREVVVLGRHNGVGGRYRGRLDIAVEGIPLIAHTTLLDGADPALGGPGGTAGARAVGTLLLAGPSSADDPAELGAGSAGESPRARWAWTELDGPGRMLLAVGEPGAVIALLDAAAAKLGGFDG